MRRNSSALAMELRLLCTNPSICISLYSSQNKVNAITRVDLGILAIWSLLGLSQNEIDKTFSKLIQLYYVYSL